MNEDKINTILIDNYKNYTPPAFVHDSINRLLSGIPQKNLIGIKSIILTDVESMTSDRRKDNIKDIKKGQKTLAFYSHKTKSKPAYISLYIDRIIGDYRGWGYRFHFVQDLIIGSILYHEIGHHIHYSKIPEYQEKEKVAKKWTKHLGGKYFWKHYWYFMIFLYPLKGILKYIKNRFDK